MSTNHLTALWRYPTNIHFGIGQIAGLPARCAELGIHKPLLVTDPGLATLPIVKNAVASNQAAGIPTHVFADIKPNPIDENIFAGVSAYRNDEHDGIIAFGGGSGLDAGKSIALIAENDCDLWDFDVMNPAFDSTRAANMPPIIAIPTTAGTGSEVGRATAVIQQNTQSKRILLHPGILPSMVIADPELTVGLPPHITAATGMDALSHSLEAYCGTDYHPMADGIALESMRLIHDWLPTAVQDGQNLEARSHMLAAASMGAAAFQKALGAIHSLSHPLGAVFDIHHGLANAILMPYVLRYNRPAIEDKMIRLARYLGLPHASFNTVLDWILALRADIGIPHTLAGLDIDESRLDELANMAVADPCTPENPQPITAKAFREIYVAALAGNL